MHKKNPGSNREIKNQYPLKILVNGRPLGTVLTGIARYTRSLYTVMDNLNDSEVIYFCFGRMRSSMPGQSNTVASSKLPYWAKKSLREGWRNIEDILLRRTLDGNNFDVYHETGLLPSTIRTETPIVQTIYDLSLVTKKEFHPRDRVNYFEKYFYKRLASVDHIITISQYVKQEIIDFLDVDPANISVVSLAASNEFFKRSESDVLAYQKITGVPREYILSVGTREPRKNLSGLVKAYARLDSNLPLVCVGGKGWLCEGLDKEISSLGIKDKVHMLGHIPDHELALMYSGAKMMVFPSFYEGFGLPIVEAMACGCPVISSNTASMPEVAGGAAVLVDPENVEDISEAIGRFIDDEKLRNTYASRGCQRVNSYSWEKAASETLSVFRSVTSKR